MELGVPSLYLHFRADSMSMNYIVDNSLLLAIGENFSLSFVYFIETLKLELGITWLNDC